MRLASEAWRRIVGARGAAGHRCPQVLGVRGGGLAWAAKSD